MLVLAACAHPSTDPRDHTEDESLAYITETIFVPYCGTAECHSSFRRELGYVFDSVAAAQVSIQSFGLVACTGSNGQSYDPCDGAVPGNDLPGAPLTESTILVGILNATSFPRMPFDQPLADKDIAFIGQWIVDGADGYVSSVTVN